LALSSPSASGTRAEAFDEPREVPGWAGAYLAMAVVADVVAAVLSEAVSVGMTGRVPLAGGMPGPYLWFCILGPVLWVAMVAASRGYERRLFGMGPEELMAIPRAATRMVAATALLSYGLYDQRPYLSRVVVLTFFPTLLVTNLMLRSCLRRALRRRRRRGRYVSRAVLVGLPAATSSLAIDLNREKSHGMVPVAAIAVEPRAGVMNRLDRVLRIVDEQNAGTVVVANPSGLGPHELRRLSWALEQRAVELVVSTGIMEVAGPRLSIRPVSNLSLLHVEPSRHVGVAVAVKHMLDRLLAALALLVSLPILGVVALAIRLDSRGPVIFRQTRVGRNGDPFVMLKFRSMTEHAERDLVMLRRASDDGNGLLFKLREDPRVTRVGKVIRRYSIDELPQLVNVLRGDMSLVGPRPPLPTEVERYESDVSRRFRVRPGLTGLWQVSGRSDLPWGESVRLDLWYVDNWSLVLDLHIVTRTLRAVLRRAGAY
jgi:exopolysaccharide biosynthesis polyprenyl glycosylphosphotransferase